MKFFYSFLLFFGVSFLFVSCNTDDQPTLKCFSPDAEYTAYLEEDVSAPEARFEIFVNRKEGNTDSYNFDSFDTEEILISPGDTLQGLFIAEDWGAGIRSIRVDKGFEFTCVDSLGNQSSHTRPTSLASTTFSNETEPGDCVQAQDTLSLRINPVTEECDAPANAIGTYWFVCRAINWHNDTTQVQIYCILE